MDTNTVNTLNENVAHPQRNEVDDEFNDDFFDDPKVRKPKGKKIKKMRIFDYDR